MFLFILILVFLNSLIYDSTFSFHFTSLHFLKAQTFLSLSLSIALFCFHFLLCFIFFLINWNDEEIVYIIDDQKDIPYNQPILSLSSFNFLRKKKDANIAIFKGSSFLQFLFYSSYSTIISLIKKIEICKGDASF